LALDKDKIKESLTVDDIKKILKDLGSDLSKSDKLIFQTVCHNGCKHKLYYYEDSKLFHCYTDCGDSFDIYELIIRAKREKGYEFRFNQAVQYVASLTGKAFYSESIFDQINNELIDDWEWINRFKKKGKQNIKLPVYDKRVMDLFLHLPHEAWLDEGISIETMEKFNICYYIREDRIVIPHYDIDGNLVGLRGRAMKQEDIDAGRKYMPLIIENKLYNHPTMFNLYGLHKTKDAIKRLRKVAIFEGEKSVLKCEDYYSDNNFSVATCSSFISDFQRDLLLSLGIEECFIGYDKQFVDPKSEEAYEYAEKLLKLAQKFVPYVKTYILWDDMGLLDFKDAPVDKGKETLETLMKRKYEVSTIREVNI
jgi:hypothetical protein